MGLAKKALVGVAVVAVGYVAFSAIAYRWATRVLDEGDE